MTKNDFLQASRRRITLMTAFLAVWSTALPAALYFIIRNTAP